MTSWITTKLLGYASGGLLVALLLSSGFAGLQTHRLGTATETIATLKGASDLAVTVANQRGLDLAARDEIIAQQSGSIDALALAARQARSVYTAGIAKADSGAKAHEARARELLDFPAPSAPADRCEAARSLIEQELRNVH